MTDRHLELCVIGAGPRGLSVLERLCANARHEPTGPSVTVHIVDPEAPGAGAVWRTGQSRHLLANTVASQITVYTDTSVRSAGPVEPGPSLHTWAQSVALLGSSADYDEDILAEARRLGPDSYPTRALYGHYLRDAFRRVVSRAPGRVRVRVHRSRAVAMADTHGLPGGAQGVRLENRTRLDDLDAVVLAQGHLPARLTPREERTASLARIHHLTYLLPGNPAEADLSAVAPGRPVLLRGLGLNFFDYMALLTVGRGGVFVRDGGRLRYLPCGEEPRLYAFSRRGVPHHARGENEKGAFGRYQPRLLTPEFLDGLRRRTLAGGRVRFGTDLWPLIAREVETVYYGTLLATRGQQARRDSFTEQYVALPDPAGRGRVLDAHGIAPADRWDWERIARPCAGRKFHGRAEFRSWLLAYLARDVREAKAGNVTGPLKAALDVLRDLRNEIRLAVDHGGLEGDSHRDELDGWYTPLNAFLSIGPPVSRVEEMIALIEAGVLDLTGPGTQVRLDTATPGFVANSPLAPGPVVRSGVLVEARLPAPDLRRTADPLLLHLLRTEQCATYRIPDAQGGTHETGGLAVTERPYRLLDARGRAHPRRFAYGVPTEAVHWVTAAGIRPGVDSVILRDADAIARALLSVPPVVREPAAAGPVSDPADLTGVPI
ncbi:FAD-binding protein [Streptomyces pluripotens]|uniref:FAD-binding protein n=1 Tax=Streptomyces pluripotens TaxID=1355015 RepID=A0A221P4F6_9ACTN|nr:MULTISPECIES: FAD/NAD(P)-binding protein [Streptomyces]ARP72889.1 FAD-binding protein [Streptomyces pluripotens]ASN27139.1 FAD-binding protein [Streptomyces pluripotens]KIE28895.1 FAD binding domain-containing protein [Streptomyces sp. MUSC 125]MCH0559886.1 FAD/NAD(P)-binding protein [Streptomyces sp. MUM 16J]